jgi:hypothetical protein
MAKLDNNKITDSHSTLTDTAREVVEIAQKYTEVSKIGIGFIDHTHSGRRDIKFILINGGLKIKVVGSGAVQELYIYTNNPEIIKNNLTESFL